MPEFANIAIQLEFWETPSQNLVKIVRTFSNYGQNIKERKGPMLNQRRILVGPDRGLITDFQYFNPAHRKFDTSLPDTCRAFLRARIRAQPWDVNFIS